MTTTQARTGLAIPTSTGSDPFTELKDGIRAVGMWLEANGLMYSTGLDASRPTFGTQGRVYKPTDAAGILYYDTGTAWETVGGAAAAVDAAVGVGSLRTLGAGATQAAPGDTTAAAVAQVIAADLRDWAKPGAEVPGLATTVTTVSAGPTTVVAAPASGRRVIKGLIFSTATAGATATITWAGITLGVVYFSAAGLSAFDVCLPAATLEPLQVTVSGGTVQVTGSYGDRTDALVARLGYVSSSGSANLITAGTARVVSMLWLANCGSATAATSLAIGGTTSLLSLSIPPRTILAVDTPVALTSSQSIAFTGDATNAITYLAVGR